MPADFALGQPPGPNNLTTFATNNGGVSGASLNAPVGIWSDGVRLAVADSRNHRVLVWSHLPTAGGLQADFALGQPDLASKTSNNGGISGASLSGATGLYSDGTRLWVADLGNNRVLAWNAFPGASGAAADFALGQPAGGANLTTNLSSQASGISDATMLRPARVTSDGIRLFVSDQGNNRVLCWAALPTAGGQPASAVIGQPDFASNAITSPGANELELPAGLFADGTRLWITDSANNRALVVPAF